MSNSKSYKLPKQIDIKKKINQPIKESKATLELKKNNDLTEKIQKIESTKILARSNRQIPSDIKFWTLAKNPKKGNSQLFDDENLLD